VPRNGPNAGAALLLRADERLSRVRFHSAGRFRFFERAAGFVPGLLAGEFLPAATRRLFFSQAISVLPAPGRSTRRGH
jgi:hypothetical protein